MKLMINGEVRECPHEASVAGLLAAMDADPARVAVMVNETSKRSCVGHRGPFTEQLSPHARAGNEFARRKAVKQPKAVTSTTALALERVSGVRRVVRRAPPGRLPVAA